MFKNFTQNVKVKVAVGLFMLVGVLFALTGFMTPSSGFAGNDIGSDVVNHDKGCKYKPARKTASVISSNSFDDTLQNVRDEITSRPLGIFAEVDHRQNAINAGLDLRPTTTIIFGNPNVGTQLMQENQAIGLELPLKMVVWEDECEVVRIAYTEPSFLQKRFRIKTLDNVFGNIANVLDAIATGAAASSDPYP